MTERLYYWDSKLRDFEAEVVEQKPVDRDEDEIQHAVRLDRTAFYPTSGGQPHDVGTLNGVPVIDVWEDERDDIWHGLAGPLEVERVHGSIDGSRRFDHMQQHSGQHLLSAAFDAELDARTVGFHLGDEESTIDLDRADLTWALVSRVEDAVNATIWADHPVEIRMIAQSQVDEVELRKPPTVAGEIRVVMMGSYDASACGGTHVTRTGEIGAVKVINFANHKDGSRVTFVSGGRALHHYQDVLQVAEATALQLSVAISALPEAVARLQDEVKTSQRALREVKVERAALEADKLWRGAVSVDGVHVVIAQWEDRDTEDVRATALRLRERPRTLVLLAATGHGVRMVCARSDDLPEINAVEVLHRALEPLGGRGGGSPTLAQGGAAPHDPDIVVSAMKQSYEMGGMEA